ncbi:MAG TPA: Gfo/Idh/MocA family oxidoreductase [Anaerolineales bacterium]|nr:Gfo/Idh/MocA family oxidoreductase [Anaerolineales bacterium]
MKFLIAGLGSIGRRHFRNLRALGEHDILLYRTHKATLPDDELAGVPVETDLHAALARKPDAVIVSNPTALHLDVAIPAAEAGCHLFLEKPVSHSMEGVDKLREAVARNGVRVLVGFQFRFHPGLRTVKDLLARGEIGQPVSVRVHWGEYLPNWHPWEDFRVGYAARPDLGGGVVLTLCHPLDYLRMLLGEAEVAWSLTSNQGLGLPVEDTAEIGLRFANGAVGSVHLDYVQRPPGHWLELVGTEGTIRWDNADGAVKIFRVSNNDWETVLPPAGFERNTMFADEMKHFVAIMRGEQSPACTLEDGVKVLEMCLGILGIRE